MATRVISAETIQTMLDTLDQFTRKLSDSGLMSIEQLESFCSALPADQKPAAAAELSRRLVEQNVLTKFQVDAVSSGDPDPLIVGDYVILDRIGEGGMGVVYKARHRLMKRTVAVKQLSPRICEDDSALRRFEREVAISASLHHHNIVAALDARQEHSKHYLIMEYVEGRSLSDVLEDGVLSVRQAVDYVIQIATGCAHAHELGVIHRDIKPSNIVVDTNDVIKILDMGLARTESPGNDWLATTQDHLTSAGIILGTLDYMSPEQALNSRSANHHTDIYSLGCTLYFLLIGQPVYSGETPMEKLVAHREQTIPLLSAARSDVPPALDAVFARMVAKQAVDRFQSMLEVIQALQPFLLSEVAVVPDDDTPLELEVVSAEPTAIIDAPAAESVQQAVISSPAASAVHPSQPARSSSFARLKRTPLIVLCRIGVAIIGGFAGADLGGIAGWLPAMAGAAIYVWFGWQLGGGYAWMAAWQLGWSPFRPETKAGELFAMDKARLHGIAILLGGTIGWAAGGLWQGIFIGLTVLALTDRLRDR